MNDWRYRDPAVRGCQPRKGCGRERAKPLISACAREVRLPGQRLSGDLVIEDIGAKIEPAGPGDRPRERVDGDGAKDGFIAPRLEDATADEVREIDFALDAVGKAQAEPVVGERDGGEDAHLGPAPSARWRARNETAQVTQALADSTADQLA